MKKVLLSFDIEEFDMPFEYGKHLPLDEQLAISKDGCEIIVNLLRKHEAQATFFSTVVFAQNAHHMLATIRNEHHELASHGFYHSAFSNSHLLESRLELEKLSGLSVTGFRMPRMMPVDDDAIESAGYRYNSSINPVWLPGRYNNRDKPRTLFRLGNVWQLPASATPALRVPLFWLSFHNFPLSVYLQACTNTMNQDNYLNLYFHPWEFTDLSSPRLGMPWYVRRNSGESMRQRFDKLLGWMKSRGYAFSTVSDFLGAK
ncbi:MAG TPA: polysaccharide deacetylase family protein [Chryseolinea sp.]|nr:polysaccharide deacetylase family protein [Chryseolinea sp.]